MKKPRRAQSVLLVCLSVMLLAFGCSDDDDGGTAPPPPDTDPPQIASVNATNQYQIQVTFNESVDRTTAEDSENYTVYDVAGGPSARAGGGSEGEIERAPGATRGVQTVAQVLDNRVLLTLWDDMTAEPFAIFVEGVKDLSGNAITTPDSTQFNGSIQPDQTGPELLTVTPVSGAPNVGVGESMIARFDEPVDLESALQAFTFRTAGNVTAVSIIPMDWNILLMIPVQPMPGGTACTARFDTALEDWLGNHLAAEAFWGFSTTTEVDEDPPTLVSTNPGDGATNVPLDVVFQLNFSEAIDPLSVSGEEGSTSTSLNPPVEGELTFSTDGRTLTFTPDDPLGTNTSYTLVVPDGAVRDLAGNPLSGTTTVQFTTGTTLPSGFISGIVSGHSGTQAANPAGALAVAPTRTLFSDEDDDLPINGTDEVGPTGSYRVERLPDAWYFPFAIMDSNNDGNLDPDRGDAIGAYGADILQGVFDIDSVNVVNGVPTEPNANFPLFDPVAIAGTVSYVGTALKDGLVTIDFYVGVFDTADFDPDTSMADYGTYPQKIAFMPRYAISTLSDADLPPGTYYVGAYMDVNGNGDPNSNEPAAWYGNGTPSLVTVENGADRLNIDITLEDPGAGGGGMGVWRQPEGTASRDREARARFREHINRMVEQLNRQK